MQTAVLQIFTLTQSNGFFVDTDILRERTQTPEGQCKDYYFGGSPVNWLQVGNV